MFAAERHGSLQHNDAVLVQLAGLLSGRDTSTVRAGSSGTRHRRRLRHGRADRIKGALRGSAGRIDRRLHPRGHGGGGEPTSAPRWRGLVHHGDRASPTRRLPDRSGRRERGAGIRRLHRRGLNRVLAQADEGGVRLTRRVRGGAVVVSSAENTGSEIGAIRVRGEPGPIDVQREPGLEQRYLNGRFPKHVRLGDVVSLVVLIGVQQTERLSAALAPVAIPPEGVEVVLNLIDHPGFTARSPERVPITVYSGVDSPLVAFDLEATAVGVHALQLDAFLGGTHLGGLHVQTTIEAEQTTGQAVEHVAPVGGSAGDPGEVSLIIKYDPTAALYRYQLIDWSGDVPEEAVSHQLLKTPSQAVEELVTQLNAVARGTSPWDAPTTLTWLKNQGIALWNGFIPEALKTEFWTRRDRISRMTVISSGDPVPWELLYPRDPPDRDAGFLVDQFPVARRRFGHRPPNQLRIGSAGVVLSGADSLKAVPAEVQAITQLLEVQSVATQTIATLPALLDRFDAADLGLLHFACHNAFDESAPNASRIMIEGQPFEPVFLEQHTGRLGKTAPLVFMNACRTDGQAPLYTTLEGWASSFLRAGAGAFVGSLWEVVDSSASTYAQEFYRMPSRETLWVRQRVRHETRSATSPATRPGWPTPSAETRPQGSPRISMEIPARLEADVELLRQLEERAGVEPLVRRDEIALIQGISSSWAMAVLVFPRRTSKSTGWRLLRASDG